MRVLGKEEFLSANDRKLVSVQLPADIYGEDVGFYVRVLSGEERSEIEKQFIDTDLRSDPGGFRAAILVSTIVDESGNRIFTAVDKTALMSKNAGSLEKFFEASCEINGFTKKDVETLEKN